METLSKTSQEREENKIVKLDRRKEAPKISSDGQKAEVIDFEQKKIEREIAEAEKQFESLIKEVSVGYENKDIEEDFNLHNKEILSNIVELAIKKRFNKTELKIAELAAILHDMTKADVAPEKYKNIPNYTLAMHAKTAAEKVPEILTDERLKELKIESDPEMIRQKVAGAILEHMGPRPGFMSAILEKFKKDMEDIGEKGVDYPEASGKISEAVLAADMKSLAGEKGRKKVLGLRAKENFFIKQDLGVVEEYKKYGINLSQGEAALISGFESAFQARDMQKDKENWDWINEEIEKSKKVEYVFLGEKIIWEDVTDKITKYEENKKLEEARDRLKVA